MKKEITPIAPVRAKVIIKFSQEKFGQTSHQEKNL